MEYRIVGQTVPVVEVKLNKDESMYTQSGGMAYQTEGKFYWKEIQAQAKL